MKYITYQEIKEIVEEHSEINNLEIRSRKRYIVDCRSSYFKLCKLFALKFTLGGCGDSIGLDHATVMHGITSFDNLYKNKSFTANEVYTKSLKDIEELGLTKNDLFLARRIKTTANKLDKLINLIEVDYDVVEG